MLRNLATVIAALKTMVAGLAIIVLFLAIDPTLKQGMLSWAVIFTAAVNLAIVIYLVIGAPGLGLTDRQRRGALYSATLAVVAALVALLVILVPLGLGFWVVFGVLLVMFIVTLAQDIELSRRIIG